MPTAIMDAFLGKLPVHQRLLVEYVFAPFRFTVETIERQRAEERNLLQREVSVGQRTLVVFGKNESELDAREAFIHERTASILATMEEDEFEEEFNVRGSCMLPSILELRELHPQYPIFGLLICAHDIGCNDCEQDEDQYPDGEARGIEEEGATPAGMIASLSDADQTILVSLARRFLSGFERHFPRSQRMALEVDDEAELIAAIEEMDWFPVLAKAFSADAFLWMVRFPYFFQESLASAKESLALQKCFWKLESDLVAELPIEVQATYDLNVGMLMGDEKHHLLG